MKVKIKKTHPDAVMPKYGTPGAACFDLHAICGAFVLSGDAQTFDTGLAVEIPPGHVMKVYSRSGHGFKNGIRLANVVGIIDSDYRGDVLVRLHNDSDENFYVSDGDRIAQAMIEKADQVEFEEVAELSRTERGAGGFGSTGR